MAKALFLSLPLHGHTNPTLPLVRELVRRGEEVVYYSSAAFAARVVDTGATHRVYGCQHLLNLKQERMEELPWLLMRSTAEVLAGELDAFRAERPDYIVTYSVAPWGQWTAQVLRLPVVTSISTFAINRRVLAYGMSHGVRPRSGRVFLGKLRYLTKALVLMRRLQRRYGVRGPGLARTIAGQSDLNVVYTSRYFQPCAESFGDAFQFIGPSMERRLESSTLPWGELRDPMVYVSMGTLFNQDWSFYKKCFEALGREDIQVILSSGGNVSRESLGPPPQNFAVFDRVPQLDVLGRAAAFVTHGGMNSVSESLFHGVPVVVVPQMSEQEVVGRRVEELGAGLFLAKAEVTPERLLDSVRRLLQDDRFRRGAASIRDSFLAAGGVSRAADAIQAFISTRASV